ncbi:MAG: phosphotransferase [Rhizobiaceae bacterium]|nr:phosphotransferase [Rhizobiaceae bacterium]
MAEAARKVSDIFDQDRSSQVEALSKKVFGRVPERVAFPGGTSRSAFIADMGRAPFVFAKREDKEDAQLEGIVLRTLGPSGYVPKLKAVVENWVVQEFIAGERLPVVMDNTPNMADREKLVADSLESLVHIHEQAHASNLHHRVPRIGTAENWLWNRTGAAKRISKTINIPAPELDREKLVELMDVKRDEFIKWDARPGNAMVTDDRVLWFDWEDCGRSKALDDLAFVLCDEWMNLDAEAEERLLETYFPFFNRSLSPQAGQLYLRLFGVTHMILRIRMAQKLHARKDEWWDRDYCLQGDKVGVTAEEMGRQVRRIRRWADGIEQFGTLLPWLDDVADYYKLD